MKKHLEYFCFVVTAFCFVLCFTPETISQVVIVNKANPIEKISKSLLRNIFLGNYISWENGRRIQIVDFTSDIPLRKLFDENILNLSPQKVSMIWVKVSLSGKSIPPKIVHAEEDVKSFLTENEGGIGYIKNSANLPHSLKIIQVSD